MLSRFINDARRNMFIIDTIYEEQRKLICQILTQRMRVEIIQTVKWKI
jgi:hypothetical protein